MKAETICNRILDGHYDDDLEEMNATLIARMKELRAREATNVRRKLRTGDVVRVKPNARVRPRYIAGLRFIVDTVGSDRVTATCTAADRFEARRFGTGTCRLTLSVLEKVTGKEATALKRGDVLV